MIFGVGKKAPVVRIAYRDLTRPAPNWDPNDLDRGYAYTWPFKQQTKIGDRVIVEHSRGQAAVVVGFGTNYRDDLSAIHHLATDAEIEAARKRAAKEEVAWLTMARKAAGLPTSGRVRSHPPEGFPDVAPTEGAASASEAGQFGNMWWRVFKSAQTAKWPREEVARIKSIARRWYAVRDKGGN
jgi:hypothetical protein